MSMLGGVGEAKPVDNNIRNICKQIKEAAEEKSATRFNEFKPVSYKSQVVAGTMYYIKVEVGHNKFNVYKVFVGLPQSGKFPAAQLKALQENVAPDAQIGYF